MWWFSCDFHTKLKCIQQFIKKIHRKKGTEANQREKIKQEYMLQPWNDRFVNLSMVINHNFCDTLNWIWCLVEKKKHVLYARFSSDGAITNNTYEEDKKKLYKYSKLTTHSWKHGILMFVHWKFYVECHEPTDMTTIYFFLYKN